MFSVYGETNRLHVQEAVNASISTDKDDEDDERISVVELEPILEGTICHKIAENYFSRVYESMGVLQTVSFSENVGDEPGIMLPKHMRCAAHTLNLVATTDADKALSKCGIYKKYYRSAFAKAQEL